MYLILSEYAFYGYGSAFCNAAVDFDSGEIYKQCFVARALFNVHDRTAQQYPRHCEDLMASIQLNEAMFVVDARGSLLCSRS